MRIALLSLPFLASVALGQFPGPPRRVNVGWQDTVKHRVGFVPVGRNVRIHYLDYGGTGEALLLLPGIGNNAHAYDDFARAFTDKFHVYSMTRRGFGESSKPVSGYDLATLTRDIRIVADSLKLTRFYLAGHSFAGQEMTRFVRTYPGRVIKMVYLDGAFDNIAVDSVATKVFGDNPGSWPTKDALTDADTLTARAYVDYVHRTRGVKIPEQDIRVRMSYDGIIEEAAPPYVSIASQNSDRPDWPTLPVPALGIFAVRDSASQSEPWILWQKQHLAAVQDVLTRQKPIYDFAVKDFLRAPKSKALVVRGGHHWVFVSHRDIVVQAMRDFLLDK